MTIAMPNTLTLFALIVAFGVLGIVIADTIIAILEAEATRGCPLSSPGANASKGKCVRP
jgi:hypothetical protein